MIPKFGIDFPPLSHFWRSWFIGSLLSGQPKEARVMLQITPLHERFAAEVTGLDLAAGPDEAGFALIRAAF